MSLKNTLLAQGIFQTHSTEIQSNCCCTSVCPSANVITNTLSKQLEFTRRFPGLMSRCKIWAECRYFKPVYITYLKLMNSSVTTMIAVMHLINIIIVTCSWSLCLRHEKSVISNNNNNNNNNHFNTASILVSDIPDLYTGTTNEQFFVFSPSSFSVSILTYCHVILRQHAAFHQYQITHGRDMMSY